MEGIKNKLVIFGAGKIGRSFIAQLFSQEGYGAVFIDINKEVIDALNQRGSYELVLKSIKDEVIKVDNVSGILASDEKSVIDAIINCSIMATCVGKNALTKIIPTIAKGVEARYRQKPGSPVDIILAENIRGACQQMRESFRKLLTGGFPLDSYIGLIETSIGKMVPIMPKEIERADPLLVYAEPYNTLIVGKSGFKNPIPDVKGLSAKENIKAWVDRKAFIHNLGHAAVAYYGFCKYPRMKYLYEILENRDALCFTFEVMEQSANALSHEYQNEFNGDDLFNHIKDLISRFRNKALGDTVFRVGSDLKRKLGGDDRVVGAIRMAQKHNCRFDKILETLVYGLLFRPTDDYGMMFPDDQVLAAQIGGNLKNVLIEVCGFDLRDDKQIIESVLGSYSMKLKKTKHPN